MYHLELTPKSYELIKYPVPTFQVTFGLINFSLKKVCKIKNFRINEMNLNFYFIRNVNLPSNNFENILSKYWMINVLNRLTMTNRNSKVLPGNPKFFQVSVLCGQVICVEVEGVIRSRVFQGADSNVCSLLVSSLCITREVFINLYTGVD
jgi:hypothetical protein